jgi:pilus assembly protein CpaC
MIGSGRIRDILLSLALIAVAVVGVPTAHAQGFISLSEADALAARPIYLGVNKSVVIELPRPAGDVLVSNPAIADAVLRTSTRLYLIGMQLGQANVFLFDQAGGELASFDVYVEADLTALNQLLAEAIPDGYVRADAMNGNIVLRGQVASSSSSSRAQEITVGMLQGFSAGVTGAGSGDETAVGEGGGGGGDGGSGGGAEKRVVNLLTITSEEQVAVKVTIAEVQREIVKQLGINLQAVVDGVINFSNPTSFPINTGNIASLGQLILGDEEIPPGEDGIGATVQALEETQMLRTLAEPTLTAVSGETANFLAGGEFPVPVGSDDEGITIEFKQFGVNLAFTPVVLSAGRISLKVRTEVSDLSATGAVSLPFARRASIIIPAVSVRRAETTVELPSGGAFVIAGLVQEETRRAASGLPFLQNLPVLGALFSSKDFLEEQTELVMIVTPYLVKPTSPQALARPDQNLVMSSDAEAYFMNRLTKVYGKAAPASGQVGFTFD